MRIAIDLDETIFDCKSILYKILNAILPTQRTKVDLKYDIIQRNEKHAKSILSKFSKIFKTEGYREIENATDIIKNWHLAGNEIILLSSRPAWKSLKHMLLSWLENFDVPFTMLVVACNNKAEFCRNHNIDILVDDSAYNCVTAEEAGLFTVYFDNHLDSGMPARFGGKIAIASNWGEIDEYVTDYAKDFNRKQIYRKLELLEEVEQLSRN